jgi:hypothetical protein
VLDAVKDWYQCGADCTYANYNAQRAETDRGQQEAGLYTKQH